MSVAPVPVLVFAALVALALRLFSRKGFLKLVEPVHLRSTGSLDVVGGTG
jgi:hypothetical protein